MNCGNKRSETSGASAGGGSEDTLGRTAVGRQAARGIAMVVFASLWVGLYLGGLSMPQKTVVRDQCKRDSAGEPAERCTYGAASALDPSLPPVPCTEPKADYRTVVFEHIGKTGGTSTANMLQALCKQNENCTYARESHRLCEVSGVALITGHDAGDILACRDGPALWVEIRRPLYDRLISKYRMPNYYQGDWEAGCEWVMDNHMKYVKHRAIAMQRSVHYVAVPYASDGSGSREVTRLVAQVVPGSAREFRRRSFKTEKLVNTSDLTDCHKRIVEATREAYNNNSNSNTTTLP